ncbi:DUF421 domain-containing protein [Arthrobacter sp. KK5.5]|uniref:DUF421 domain-containing protein n=1 Tax=Arthrobacter sp. KK5.5 TaxID=3373084 RepID=UPI003EE7F659
MWFDSWPELMRTLLVGTAAYACLVVVLRISGKRTLAQLNAFDFVVTVALGSTLATILLSKDVSWAEGLAAFAVLAGLQFVVAWACARHPRLRGIFTSEPVLLLANGVIQPAAMARNRLAESELRQAVRLQGLGDPSAAKAVVLESNGKLSVITPAKYGDGSALRGVRGSEVL